MPRPSPLHIAVTGASGFIGRHVLAELLRHDGILVTAATRDPSRLEGVDPRIVVRELDLARLPASPFVHLGRPDMLLHLAWGGLPHYRSAHHTDIELPRHQHFLDAMVSEGLQALVVTGTCFEYGMQSGAMDESMPTRPDNAYGQAKDALHRFLTQLHAQHPFALTWARLFYMYGSGQAPGALYSQLAAAVARGDRTFPMSGGAQQRDYLPVEEVARLLVHLACMQSDAGCVNVCSGQPTTVRALVEQWLHTKKWAITLQWGALPYPEHEPMAFWGSRDQLDALLGAAP